MSSGPLVAVLAELTAGAPTLDDVVRRTGLARDVVEAAVEQLVRMDRVTVSPLAVGCVDTGCGGCSVSSCAARERSGAGDRSGVGERSGAGRRGPVLVALRVVRP